LVRVGVHDDIEGIDTSGVLARRAGTSGTDHSAEGLVDTAHVVGHGTIRGALGGNGDRCLPSRTVHAHTLLVGVNDTSAGLDAHEYREGADLVGARGRCDVADGGVGVTIGRVDTLVALLNAVRRGLVPDATEVRTAAGGVAVERVAGTLALIRRVPAATCVTFARGAVGVNIAALAADIVHQLAGRVLQAVRGDTRLACLVAGTIHILAGRVVHTISRVGHECAVAVAASTARIPTALTALVHGVTACVGHLAGEVLAATAALTNGDTRAALTLRTTVAAVVLDPVAHDAPDAAVHVRAERTVVLAAIVGEIPHAVVVGAALGLLPVTVLTLRDALTTSPRAENVVGARGLLRGAGKGVLARCLAHTVVQIPHTIRASVRTGQFRRCTSRAAQTARIVIEVEALILCTASRVAYHHGTVGKALLVVVGVVAELVGVTLRTVDVVAAVALHLALLCLLVEPHAHGLVHAGARVREETATLTADIVDWVPGAVTTRVDLVVAVVGRQVRTADLAARTRAGHLKRENTVEVLVGVVIDVERHLRSRVRDVERLALLTATRGGSGEGRPQELVAATIVQVAAAARGVVLRDGVLDRGKGGAELLRVAREEDEDHVDGTRAIGDRLAVVGDRAAHPSREVHSLHRVGALIGNEHGTVAVLGPLAVTSAVIVTSSLGLIVALGQTARSSRPVPLAARVVVAARLRDVLVLARHVADGGVIVPRATSVVLARVLISNDVTLLHAHLGRVEVLALAICNAHALQLIEAAATCASVVLPLAVVVVQADAFAVPAANLRGTVLSVVAPLAVLVVVANGHVGVVVGAE